MRLGLQIQNFTFPGGDPAIRPRVAEIARTAEEAGFYSVWVMDHFFQLEDVGPAEDPMLEAYSTLGYLAAITERVKLGTLVTGVNYRYPGFLIKQVTTLDVLSGGRAYFGVGAGWFEREARGLGMPFPPLATRYEWLEETLQIARQMWSGDRGPFEGKHWKLAETLSSPQPVTKPHPPIMVGGTGEQKTLRLVAQYADACNLWFTRGNEKALRRKFDILRRHCDEVGRDFSTIELTAIHTAHLAAGHDTPAEIIGICRRLAEVGVQHVMFEMPANTHELEPLRVFGREIIPAVADL